MDLPWLSALAHSPPIVALILIGTAILLVSTVPVWSFKNFKVPAEVVLPLLLGTGVFAAILLAEPWAALAAAGILYIGMLPLQHPQLPPSAAGGRGHAHR